MYKSLIALSFLTLGISASPITGRADSKPADPKPPAVKDYAIPTGADATILNYALTLEYLERAFYKEALDKYKPEDFTSAGFPDTFYTRLQEIYADEQTHVTLLSSGLTAAGAVPVKEATYKFPYTTPAGFVALSSVIEGVGVSAYLGAATVLASKAYITAAGAVLTVESRHSAYIRSQNKQAPFPKAFDTPLNFNQGFSLAAEFITGFAAGDAPLPFAAFPKLAIAISPDGKQITFTKAHDNAVAAKLIEEATPVFAVFYSGLDTYYVKAVPKGPDFTVDQLPVAAAGGLAPAGQVYVVLSTADGDKTKVLDENTLSGVGVLEFEDAAGGEGDGQGVSLDLDLELELDLLLSDN